MKLKCRLFLIGVLCIPSIYLFLQLKEWGPSILYRTDYTLSGFGQSISNSTEETEISHEYSVVSSTSTSRSRKINKLRRKGKNTSSSFDEDNHKSTSKTQTPHFSKASETRRETFPASKKKHSEIKSNFDEPVKTMHSSKLFLLYTPIFGKLPWLGVEENYNFKEACPVTNCEITYKKTLIPSADVVLFHAFDMPSVKEMTRISIRRPVTQRWVYFIQESPLNTPYDPGIYNGFFNWTMTYRRDSDIFLPYRHYAPLSATDKKPERKNYASGKDKLVAWMVGHCGIIREKYAKILSQYLNLDVYGTCSRNFHHFKECPKGSTECSAKLKRYKFYLSFENSYCVDYITEKYWYTPFHHDMVPVVFGGSDYGPEVAIPGSFINVLDFPTIKHLANYILYLNKNDTAYNEYFNWKQQYKQVGKEAWTCRICSMRNKKLEQKACDLGKFWGINESCSHYKDKINKLIV